MPASERPEWLISEEPDGSAVIRLKKPIKVSGQETGELNMPTPTAAILQKLDGLGIKVSGSGDVALDDVGPSTHKLLQAVCGLTPGEINQMHLADVGRVLQHFFGGLGLSGLIGGS